MSKKTTIIMIVILVGVVAFGLVYRNYANKDQTAEDVTTTTIKTGKVEASIQTKGYLEEKESFQLKYDTPVKVKNVFVKENQKVKKGDKLVELDLSELNSQIKEQSNAKSNISITEIKSRYNSAVSKSNTIASQIREINSQKQTLKNNSGNQLDENKEKELDELDQKLVQLSEESRLQSTEVSATKKELQESQNTINTINSKIKEIQDKINSLNANVVNQINGVVTEIKVSAGGTTTAGESVITVINDTNLQIKASVKEIEIADIKEGQNVNIKLLAIADTKFKGKVASVSPIGKRDKNLQNDNSTFDITISLNQQSPKFKPGMSTNCEIITNTISNAVLAGYDIFRDDKNGNKIVFVVNNKSVLEERKVKTGFTTDMKVEIKAGLKKGDVVVVNPSMSLKKGTKVSPTPKKDGET